MEKQRLFVCEELWNEGDMKATAVVWGDLAKANAIAISVWDTIEDVERDERCSLRRDGTYEECCVVMMGQATLLSCVTHVTSTHRLGLSTLRDALRARGQPTGGKKEALAERLLTLLDVTPLPAI